MSNVLSNTPRTSFIMPDCDVVLKSNWTELLTITSDGAVSASDKLKAMTADTPIDLVIPAEINGIKVTSMGAWGFSQCYALKTVTIPEGVTEIGARAFRYCTSLVSINIPSTVTTIAAGFNGTFEACNNLTSIFVNAPKDSITGAPWSATNATINWLG